MRPLVALLLLAGCKEEQRCPVAVISSDRSCITTSDCDGLLGLSCVDGICKLPCVRDSDCVLPSPETDLCRDIPEPPLAICEDQLCVEGCTSAAECQGGERCAAGRCVFYYEGFEARQEGEFVTLDRLSFDLIGKELDNEVNAVVSDDSEACSVRGLCPGIASDGVRFALLGTSVTPERSRPEIGLTCRSCACCLDCLSDPPQVAPTLDDCPRSYEPPRLVSCPDTIPATCQSVCSECERCPDSSRVLGQRLLACEATAASRTCSSCASCEQGDCTECRVQSCSSECFYVSTIPCRDCENLHCPACADCRTCYLCSELAGCTPPCEAEKAACDPLAWDGCFAAPIHYPRAQLTDLEQSLISPEIDLSTAIGSLELMLDYIAFDVGDAYRPGIQDLAEEQWAEREQEVVVAFCGGRCEEESSWIEGEMARGGRASFPASSQKNNGLTPGEQSMIDWTIGRIEVVIPDSVRTPEFRFRLLPRLGAAARVGIDNIQIRR